jgi:hypothetical protein
MDARLDTMTRAKLEELAAQFRRSRAAVLRQVMHWALSRKPSGRVDKNEAHV